jgi:hypothetical protein
VRPFLTSQRFVRPFLTPQGKNERGFLAMTRRTILRVWYGKRWGIRQSFKDIHNFDGAANFAALIVADRIEVVRELTALPSGETTT